MTNYAKTSADGISQATADMTPEKKKQFIDTFVAQTASSMGLTPEEAIQFNGMLQGTSTKTATSQANTADIITNRDTGIKIKQQNANKVKSSNTKTPTTKFDKPTTTALYGAGLSGTDTKSLGDAIYKYGAQEVLDKTKGMKPEVRTILENLYGITSSTTPQ
jgi:hypothetical protein